MRSVVISAFLTAAAVITMTTAAEELCLGKTEVATKLDFFNSKVTRNDLHKISMNGVNEGMIKYENIGVVRDQPVDLVVTVVPGTTYSTPNKKAKSLNGKSSGSFGSINIMTWKDDDVFDGEGNFEFCFYDKQDELVVVDSFRWSFYDLDERGNDKKKKGVGLKEMIVMDTSQMADFSLYPNRENSEVKLVCENSGKTPTDTEPCKPGERTQFKSSTSGVGKDNPKDPNNLTEKQKKRSVTFTYQNKSCFQVTLRHYCPVNECRKYGGGNFLFSGDADQLIAEGECIITPQAPTVGPTNSPTSNPGLHDTSNDKQLEESREKEEGCFGKKQTLTELDFFNSVVAENTLHKGGIIKYKGIGQVRNRDVDLIVSVVPDTTYECSWGDNGNGKGETGLFGNIALQTKKGDTKSGEGNFRFCFHDSETNDITTVDSFRFSVFDIDSRNDPYNTIKEKLIMDVTEVDDYILYPNVDESEVKVSCEDSGLPPPCQAGERTVFHSSTKGVFSDNPNDPNKLTERQKKRSIVFAFKDTSCWEFTYDHYCPIEVDTNGRKTCRWYGGGNFLFSGDSKEIIEEGECVTQAPVAVPAQTNVPTGLSTGNLEESRADDVGVFLLPPPQSCPNDIKLLKQYGVKDFPATEQAIEILSQDTSTVKVQLNQAWQSSSSTIDAIFYEFKEDLFNSKCYEERDVQGGIMYAEEITIQCNLMSPKANLKICIVDDINKGFLGLEDNGTVPPCCHSTEPDGMPTVCYNLEINCNTACIEETDFRRKLGLGSGGGLRGPT